MARAITPAGGGGAGDNAGWIIPAVAVVVAAAGGALWTAGGLASMIAGKGWHSAPFTLATLAGVARHGTGTYWPGTNPRLVLGGAGLLAVLVLGPAAALALVVLARQPAADDPARSLARNRHLAALLPRAAAVRAQRLRPSLATRKVKEVGPGDIGIVLGTLAKRTLYASWEDVAVAFMAPRSGKTTSLAVPITLAAPGAVVLTSNKTEGWQETSALRAADTGEQVWTFDPQGIARVKQTWWVDLLRGLGTVAEASRLAGHFVSTVEGERGDIWGPAAKELLASLMLAASVSGEHTLIDVYEWLADEATPVPRGILAKHGFELLSRTVRGTQDAPPETRGSVYFTARAATACLRDGQITAWITPHEGMTEFRPEDFPQSRETLYLLSKDEGGSAGPLVAALTDRVLRAGVVAAEQRGGRLDPPMVLVLDEAANICRIADLPALYSHLGSRGIIPWTILQSYSQAVGVWGEIGTKALWGAATIKLIGAGMDDAAFAEDISRLVGDHDVLTVSRSSGGSRSGGASRTASTRSQRILPAAAIRQLPKGTALLLATGTRPAMIRLLPWYTGPRAQEISDAATAAKKQVTTRARTPRVSAIPEDDAADAAAAADVQRALDQVATLDTPPPRTRTRAGGGVRERKLQPLYPSVQAWVEGVFAVVFVHRATNTFRWCREWWRHPEAIVRLEALWRSWELLRLDPTTGMGVWFRDHLDHSLPILTGPAGPFADCDPAQHYDPETSCLPVDPAPEGWWDIPAPTDDPADAPTETGTDDRTPS